MPPSGSKPTAGAGYGYGIHEFHVRLRRFELKDGGLYIPVVPKWLPLSENFLVMLTLCCQPATI
jgi:hypothetical protein